MNFESVAARPDTVALRLMQGVRMMEAAR